jgi:hypothetical protein
MTALLDKKRSATSNVQSPHEATLDQLLSRITTLAPVVARHAPDANERNAAPARRANRQKLPVRGRYRSKEPASWVA